MASAFRRLLCPVPVRILNGMKRLLMLVSAAALLVLPVTVHAQQSAVATAMLPQNPAVTTLAMQWVHRVQTAQIDRSQLDGALNRKLTNQAIGTMRAQLAPLGDPTGIAYGGGHIVRGQNVYRYVVVFPNTAVQEYIVLGQGGKIAGLLFTAVH